MSALLKSELLKLRTVRTPRYSLLGLLAFSLVVAGVAAASIPLDLKADAPSLRMVLGVTGGLFPALVMLIMGALSSAEEYRHGTILGTYLVTPERRRALAAKVLVIGAVAGAAGLACGTLTLGVAVPIAHSRGLSTGLPDATAWLSLVAACVGVPASSAALGVGLGACFRSPVVAVVAILGWSSFGEGLLSAVIPEPLLPFGAIRTAVTLTSGASVWVSAGALVAYTAITVFLATRIYIRQDVIV